MAKKRKSVHHRIYPYMEEVVQYGNERPDGSPWVVRDRSSATRSERRGYGRAMVRLWTPGEWMTLEEWDEENDEDFLFEDDEFDDLLYENDGPDEVTKEMWL